MSFNDTGAALGHQGIDLVPLAGIQLTESILGFRIKAQSKPKCSNDEGCEMSIDFVLDRPPLVRFVVIIVVIVNCEHPFPFGHCGREDLMDPFPKTGLITIAIFLMMCESVGSFNFLPVQVMKYTNGSVFY
jgi:hypothetical protein